VKRCQRLANTSGARCGERTAIQDGAVVERSLRRKRVNQFGVHDEVAAEHQDGTGVVGCAAVVGGGEQRDELALREALEPCVRASS
jgi:hypothetical protein